MPENRTITVSLDKDLADRVETIVGHLSMDLPLAFELFAQQIDHDGKLPFDVTVDPFYSVSNQRALRESIRQLEEGKVVVKTLDELLAMSK